MKPITTRNGKVRELLYDDEHDLRLGIAELEELEEKCQMGAYGILRHMVEKNFYVNHVLQVIRLGLIGSGEMSPQQAARFIKTKLSPKDDDERVFVMDYYEAAMNALAVALYGPEDDAPGKVEVTEDMISTPTTSPSGENSTEQHQPSDFSHLSFEE